MLRLRGIFAIWSAFTERAFTQRPRDIGFQVTETQVRARPNNKGFRHVIWFARKP
ncbi:hypothetical protein GGR40_004399 [Novosphingobium gossypii]